MGHRGWREIGHWGCSLQVCLSVKMGTGTRCSPSHPTDFPQSSQLLRITPTLVRRLSSLTVTAAFATVIATFLVAGPSPSDPNTPSPPCRPNTPTPSKPQWRLHPSPGGSDRNIIHGLSDGTITVNGPSTDLSPAHAPTHDSCRTGNLVLGSGLNSRGELGVGG